MRVQRQTYKLTGVKRRDHMLSWIFKKFWRTAAPATAGVATRKATEQASPQAARKATRDTAQDASQKAAQKASQRAQQLAAAQAEWAPRLQAALGDDQALLALAQATPVLDIKLAAVNALTGEAALKQADREFRNQDKRLHRAAKARLEAAMTQRETRAKAQALMDRATALDLEADLPINMLVNLDRDWQALDRSLLEAAQIEAFNGLNEALNGKLRQRSELAQQMQHWTADARHALSDWQAAAEQTAASGQPGELSGPFAQALQTLLTRCPDASAPPSQALLQRLALALRSTEQIEARLLCLASLAAAPAGTAAAATPGAEAENSPAEPLASTPATAPSQQWQALEPVGDAALARLLTQRFEQWQQAQQTLQRVHAAAAAPADSETQAAPARTKAARKPTQPLSDATPEQAQRFAALLAQAEAAQTEGLLSEMQALLQQIDTVLQGVKPVSLAEHLRERHQALLAERSRLRDWEQWGGARALDALVAEAESLAQATLAAAAPAAPAPAESADVAPSAPESAALAPAAAEAAASPKPPRPAKLNLKAHREEIHALRKRWKEVDRLSAGAGQALWPRFDAALQTANQPVAAQLAELQAAREANLAGRELLLDQVDGFAAADAGLAGDAAAANYWKDCARALSSFQLAWRQLGPVEHTVPMAKREALLQRQRASLARLETPLQQARDKAAAQREQLIQQAEALLQELQIKPQTRELTGRVRELQAEWQNQARSLPLTRAVENDLWTRFKAATDAVFAQRSAAFDARGEAIAASVAGYEALLARLSALSQDQPDAEIRRTLAEVDREWRQGGELPRASEAALNSRLQAAHQAALQILAGRSQLLWQAQCAALAAKLQLCREQKQAAGEQGQAAGEPASDEQFKQRWAEAGALPASWERALEQRLGGAAGRADLAASTLDLQLLQLEAALDLPCSAELMAARRQLKLQALKDALEGRGSAEQGPAQHTSIWLSVLSQRRLNAEQAQRLAALVAALPNASAGTLAAGVLKP